MYIPDEVKNWASDQFKAMKSVSNGNTPLTINDMKDVREVAFIKFGYIMNVAEAVAIAYKNA